MARGARMRDLDILVPRRRAERANTNADVSGYRADPTHRRSTATCRSFTPRPRRHGRAPHGGALLPARHALTHRRCVRPRGGEASRARPSRCSRRNGICCMACCTISLPIAAMPGGCWRSRACGNFQELAPSFAGADGARSSRMPSSANSRYAFELVDSGEPAVRA